MLVLPKLQLFSNLDRVIIAFLKVIHEKTRGGSIDFEKGKCFMSANPLHKT